MFFESAYRSAYKSYVILDRETLVQSLTRFSDTSTGFDQSKTLHRVVLTKASRMRIVLRVNDWRSYDSSINRLYISLFTRVTLDP